MAAHQLNVRFQSTKPVKREKKDCNTAECCVPADLTSENAPGHANAIARHGASSPAMSVSTSRPRKTVTWRKTQLLCIRFHSATLLRLLPLYIEGTELKYTHPLSSTRRYRRDRMLGRLSVAVANACGGSPAVAQVTTSAVISAAAAAAVSNRGLIANICSSTSSSSGGYYSKDDFPDAGNCR